MDKGNTIQYSKTLTFKLSIILILMITFSCGKKSSTVDPVPNPKDSLEKQTVKNDTLTFTQYVVVYKFDSTYKDSTPVYKLWYNGDSLVKKSGEFYYPLPFESEFINDRITQDAKGKAVYETLDSTVCETGGMSAWNKYYFKYNLQKKPVQIKHYKAWWNEGLGDEERPDKPKYFLGETMNFEYLSNTVTQKTYDVSHQLIETITTTYDTNNRLLVVSWDARNEYRFKTYYTYQ